MADPNPDATPGSRVGTIEAGPLSWDRPFTVICSLQVNSSHHFGSDSVSASQGSSPTAADTHVATMSTTMNFVSGDDDQEYLCTAVSSADGTLYWDPGNAGADGIPKTSDDEAAHWTTDASSPCAAGTRVNFGFGGCTFDLVNSVGNRPFPTTPFESIGYAVDTAFDVVDFVFCIL